MTGSKRRQRKRPVDQAKRETVLQWQRGLIASTTLSVQKLAETGRYGFRDITPVFDKKTKKYEFKNEETTVVGKGALWGNMWKFPNKQEEAWAREHPDKLADCGFSLYDSRLGLYIGIENPSYDFFGEHWIPLYEAMDIEKNRELGRRDHGKETSEMEKTDNSAVQNESTKVYINLHKNYCKVLDSKINEGETYNAMIMPKGVILKGRDIGGAIINPLYMGESRFNKNEMVATYYVNDPEKGLQVKLSHKDGNHELVDITELKEAIDAQRQQYFEARKEASDQKGATKDQNKSRQKEVGEEM